MTEQAPKNKAKSRRARSDRSKAGATGAGAAGKSGSGMGATGVSVNGMGATEVNTSISYKGLVVGAATDVGQLREHNEDSFLSAAPLFVVADGMGGHAAGEVASEIAVTTFAEAELRTPDADAMKHAVAEANLAIYKAAQEGKGKMGMGTTLTAAIVEEDQVLIAQIGDSRAYIMQDSILRQATRDHSLMEELLSSGRITEEEALVHPNRSVITRALGLDNYVLADLYELRAHAGDRLLLCSDGLNGMLDNDTIEAILHTNPDPQDAADALVSAANQAGGFDNITVIVINIVSTESKKQGRLKHKLVRNIIAFVLVFVLFIGAAIGGIYAYARSQAYLIAENGYVQLYRGIPDGLLGIKLNWHERSSTVAVDSLSQTTAAQLRRGLQTDNLQAAEALLDEYLEQQSKRKTTN